MYCTKEVATRCFFNSARKCKKRFEKILMEPNSDERDPKEVGEQVPVETMEEPSKNVPGRSAASFSDPEDSSSDDSSSGSSDSSSDSDSDSGSDSDSDSSSGSDSASSSGDSNHELEYRPTKRKVAGADPSKKKRFRFLDVEADVGSSDEEDEEFIDDEAAMRESREGGRESRELELLRREAEQRRKTGGGNRLQSVIQRLEERAAKQGSQEQEQAGSESTAIVPHEVEEGYYEQEFDTAAAASAALFPTADDYKLFFVRMAEPGKERDAVIQLSHKAAEEIREAKDCQIRSIFSVDSLRGYIYIEAPNDTVAKNFLMGIRKVQWYNLVVVPQSEMAGVFRAAVEDATEKFKLLQPGEFVRIKRHALYKGDLARVIECYDRDVDLALVPRLDWFNNGPSFARPAQRLFDDKVVESLGAGEVERLRNPSTGEVRNNFRGDVYTDEGFLIKRFARTSLFTESDVRAKINELRFFQAAVAAKLSPKVDRSKKDDRSDAEDEPKAQDPLAIAIPTASVALKRSVFAIGDIVRVKAGDLKNLVAKVVLIDKQKSIVSLEPLREQARSAMPVVQVLEREVDKYFKISDHVVILTGNSAGDTGVVTAVEDSLYTILIDGEVRDVKVPGNSLQMTAEVSKGELQYGNYHLGQLVQFRAPIDSVGLVIKISKSGNFSILSVDGKKYSVTVADIEGCKSVRDAMTVSRHGDSIRKGSVVKFFGQSSLVKSGSVKDIYRNSVFVKENEKTQDGGFTVVNAKDVELVASATSAFGGMANYTGGGAPGSAAAVPAPAPSGGGYRRGARLEGKRVRIIKGPYKGQLAQVREDHDTRVQVSLEAKFRVVTIPKDCVRLEDEEGEPVVAPRVYESSGNINAPPAAAMGSLAQPPTGYVPPSSTPYTPAPPHMRH